MVDRFAAMTSRLLRWCRHALLLAALLSALGAERSQAASSLAQLTIRLSDLRSGYVMAKSAYRTAPLLTSQQQVGADLLVSHGWVEGYDALYQRASQPTVQVGETADRFRGRAGAHWWYQVSLFRVPSGYRSIALPALGDERTGVQNASFVGIIFRQGHYVIDVYVSRATPSAQAALLSLARLVDGRLLQAQIPAQKRV